MEITVSPRFCSAFLCFLPLDIVLAPSYHLGIRFYLELFLTGVVDCLLSCSFCRTRALPSCLAGSPVQAKTPHLTLRQGSQAVLGLSL